MLAVSDPIKHDLTIVCGTDHAWSFRRLTEDNTPIVPDEAKSQLRWDYGKTLWLEPEIEIAEDGWITLSVPKELTQGSEWLTRREGKWDLEIVFEGYTYRWVEGAVTISNEVTKDE